MKISFVIPAYNEEKNVGPCLASIIEQLPEVSSEVEIILVNNASTDRTGEIARSFPGVIVVDEPKKGLVQARHSGYAVSTGDIIANVDSDTMLPSGWLTKVERAFIRDPALVALSGPFIYHDLNRWQRFWVAVFYRLGHITYLVNRFVLQTGSMLQGGNFVVRRSGIEAIGGYDTSIAFYGEDTDLARRLHRVGPVVWTFKLPMYASGRRLAKEGILTMGIRYGVNYLWTTFARKPFTKEFKDIRPE